jgi:hypothetical protein
LFPAASVPSKQWIFLYHSIVVIADDGDTGVSRTLMDFVVAFNLTGGERIRFGRPRVSVGRLVVGSACETPPWERSNLEFRKSEE